MNRHRETIHVANTPADIEVRLHGCPHDGIRGYVYRRGSSEYAFFMKMKRTRRGVVGTITKANADCVRPGRYELRIMVSPVTIVATYELVFGAQIEACDTSVKSSCEDCCE